MRSCRYIIALCALAAACSGPPAEPTDEERALPADFVPPDVGGPGKADRPGAAAPRDPLVYGQVADGSAAGWVAYPLVGQRGDRVAVRGFSSDWSVLYLFGPRRGASAGPELARLQTRRAKEGLEARLLELSLPADGEYTLVIGSARGTAVDHLLHVACTAGPCAR